MQFMLQRLISVKPRKRFSFVQTHYNNTLSGEYFSLYLLIISVHILTASPVSKTESTHVLPVKKNSSSAKVFSGPEL